MSSIVITGMGVISCIGTGIAQNRKSLSNAVCGIGEAKYFKSKHTTTLPFGEIKFPTEYFYDTYKIKESGVTRSSVLATVAMIEALEDCKWSRKKIEDEDTILILGCTVGGMDLDDELYLCDTNSDYKSDYLDSFEGAATALYLQRRFKIGGEVFTINTACSSSANGILLAGRLIKSGFAKRAIVGGTDCLAKFTVNGFNALNILSDKPCKPFDDNRNGLNLGEGSGFIILERLEDCKRERIYGLLSGFHNANDAFHPSSLSDEGTGPFASMMGALKNANLDASRIDYINSHGTGTENNDYVESTVMLKIFNNVPPFNSTKSNIGHTLGAAGIIEAIVCLLTLYHQEIYPTLHFSSPIQGTCLMPITKFQKKNLRHVLSNSFAFGGNCTTLIFSQL